MQRQVENQEAFRQLKDFSSIAHLPGHVEYLSEGWLQEARKYLNTEAETRKDSLAGKRFCVSGIFNNAPPHLGMADGIATWSMSYDGGRVIVSREPNPEADLVLQGNYQAALCMAQVIGAVVPGRMDQAGRKVAAMMGENKFKTSGSLEGEAANKLIADFHDHMGRATLENPDLAHRAEQLGVADKIRHMEEYGYAVLEGILPDDMVDQARELTLRAVEYQAMPGQHRMLYEGRVFEDIMIHPQVMTLVDASLNRGAIIGGANSVVRGPGKGQIEPHTDYFFVPEPYPEYSLASVAVWSLENWAVASGPTWVVPGSHKKRRWPRPEECTKGAIPIEMPKGSALFITEGIWHLQGDRSEPGQRVSLHNHYMRGILRSVDPLELDMYMLYRNPPRLGEILGEQDWFGKLGYYSDYGHVSRDYRRQGYMTQLQEKNDLGKAKILNPGTL